MLIQNHNVPNVHSTIIYNCQDMKTTQVSISRLLINKDVVYLYNGILLSHKKNEILPFATTWMNLKDIMLSEISQQKTNIIYHLYVETLQLANITKKKQTHRENERVVTCEEGEGGRAIQEYRTERYKLLGIK